MAKRWPDAQEADEACQWGKAAKLVKARYLYGTLVRRFDRHKREGGCAIPGEIWTGAGATWLPTSRGEGMRVQKSAEGIVAGGEGGEPMRTRP